MTPNSVLDASALLALMNREPGFDRIEKLLPDACISSVNYSEVASVMLRLGAPARDLKLALQGLLNIIDFSEEQAFIAAELILHTKNKGLSLGDRACLALGKHLGLPVYTSDRVWKDLDVGVKIHLIR